MGVVPYTSGAVQAHVRWNAIPFSESACAKNNTRAMRVSAFAIIITTTIVTITLKASEL